MAEHAQEAVGAGWRDISTAPKDGTKIRLAWSPDDWTTAEGLYRDGEWFAAPLFYRDRKSKPGMMYLEFREHRVTPTYWMPLPPPPEGSGQNLADAHTKSPDIASQSERIAVLEAALRRKDEALDWLMSEIEGERNLITHPNGRRAHHIDSQDEIRVELLTALLDRARSALAPLGEE